MKKLIVAFLAIVSFSANTSVIEQDGCSTKLKQVMRPEYPAVKISGYAIVNFDIKADGRVENIKSHKSMCLRHNRKDDTYSFKSCGAFISKAIGHSLVKVASKAMIGKSLKEQKFSADLPEGLFFVKEAVLPFDKFPLVDPILGPEMKSTGEVMGIGRNFGEAYAKAQKGANKTIPIGGQVFISVKDSDKKYLNDLVPLVIDNNFKNSAYATFTGNEITLSQKMLSDIGNIKLIITSIISAVFFTLLLVTANTMSQSVRERTSDIAILKSLGYKDMQIFISILLESNFIILIGAAFGLGFTVMTVPLIDQASGGLTGGLIVFDIFQVLRGILIGVLMASLAGILPAYQAYKLKVVDALAKG